MDNKKIIIIGILLIIIAVIATIIIINAPHYEKIEITPNGTSIDVLANKTKYQNFDTVKIWTWEYGALISYNSFEKSQNELTGFAFNTITDLIKKETSQNLEGYTCYEVNADKLFEIKLFDSIKVNYNGKFYCIPITNETTHDNIIICSNDKDLALHMAKSIEYKNVYPTDNNIHNNNISSTIEKTANDLLSNNNISYNGDIPFIKRLRNVL